MNVQFFKALVTELRLSGRPWAGRAGVVTAGCWLMTVAWSCFGPVAAWSSEARIAILPALSNGWWRLDVPAAATQRVDLLASEDLEEWSAVATGHGGLRAYPDAASAGRQQRFYRAWLAPLGAADDWKHQLVFPYDAFLSGEYAYDQPRWAKFALLTAEPTRVIYQNGADYQFHYDFAAAHWDAFRGMSREEFDLRSLYPTNQTVVLGAVLVPPGDNVAEYGIQLVGLEPYRREDVARWFELVRASVAAAEGVRALYVPTLEQAASAEAHRDYFEALGIPVSSVARWGRGDAVYAAGWALGRLRFFVHGEIEAAHADGRLLATDILLTDAVPAEIPYVAGILSQTPATPNSHVAILAQSYGIPFGHLVDPAARERLFELTNRQVIVRAHAAAFGTTLEVIDVEGQLDAGLQEELLGLKAPPTIEIEPKAVFGGYWADTANLVPADIRYFGGKAANFGLLRRHIPSNSPVAIAFSFDVWEAFMDQPFGLESTLRAAISNRLAGYRYPPEIPALRADLERVREWIDDVAGFSGTLQQVITNALVQFDPQRKIRLRSSTNVEDSEYFTGAGLYESRSGCLLDDLDGDTVGPSFCDPGENDERGVFRALRKVFASLYAEHAFLERLRHGVNEAAVGMAVLVHHSYPDEIELANGVAKLIWNGGPTYQLELVTQKGAVSVTNPDGSALPEVVDGGAYGSSTYVNLGQRSSLVPLGGYVMTWEADYKELVKLLVSVAQGYRDLYPAKARFILDFEYKKVVPGVLEVKQVRELPVAPVTNTAAILINQPTEFTVFQGEAADVFANHRLKSWWHLETRNARLSGANLDYSIFTNVVVAFLDGDGTNQLTGSPADWPDARHSAKGGVLSDRWTWGSGLTQRSFALTAEAVAFELPVTRPILTLRDLSLSLSATYAEPVWSMDYEQKLVQVTNEVVRLSPRLVVQADSLRQDRTVTGTNGVTVHTSFYWPQPPTGIVAGYTAPLVEFIETRIEGLTPEPLVLSNYFSQTYRPGHHNFTEDFLFEPRLDPNVSAAQRAELERANVRWVYVRARVEPAQVLLIGEPIKTNPRVKPSAASVSLM